MDETGKEVELVEWARASVRYCEHCERATWFTWSTKQSDNPLGRDRCEVCLCCYLAPHMVRVNVLGGRLSGS